jgi:vacuolar-type H+-ATPase subunit E/Vma4
MSEYDNEVDALAIQYGMLIGENADLRAKLEAAEQAKKRYWDAIHRQYQRNIGTIRKMEKAEQDRDNLQAQLQAANNEISRLKLLVPASKKEKPVWDGVIRGGGRHG